jgi:hypothetical protein
MATLSITKGTVNDIAVLVNQTDISVTQQNNINVEVTPVGKTEITIDRGLIGPQGPVGPSGGTDIGGYPVVITGAQNFDALMFVSNEWINVNQLEISDGGNF